MRLGLQVLAALTSGMILALVAPPVNLHQVHWFSFLPLFWALTPGETRRNLLLGGLAGFSAQFTIFFWLVETVEIFSSLPTWLGFLTLTLFSLAHGAIYPLVFGLVMPLRRHLGIRWILAIPALMVTVELLYPSLFPYYQGVSQYRRQWIWQIASVTGVYGLSFLVMLVNCVLAECMYRLQEGRRLPWGAVAATTALWLANLGFGAIRYERIERLLQEAPVINASSLQLTTSMEERMTMPRKHVVRDWTELTARLEPGSVDLVVWPEGASPYNPHEGSMLEHLASITTKGAFDLLVGGGTTERLVDPETGKRSYTHYNSAYHITREGEVGGRYDKMVPLPFGEYLPLSETFPILRDWIEGPGNFRAGKVATVFEGEGFTFAAPICYEAILHKVGRWQKHVDLLVNITNDAWFGDTAAPHQHAMLATVRSIELGRPLLRIAYTGVNMVVEPHGRITHETEPFQQEATVVPIRLATVDTIYWRFGDWFGILCLLGTVGAATVTWRRSKSPQARDSAEAA